MVHIIYNHNFVKKRSWKCWKPSSTCVLLKICQKLSWKTAVTYSFPGTKVAFLVFWRINPFRSKRTKCYRGVWILKFWANWRRKHVFLCKNVWIFHFFSQFSSTTSPWGCRGVFWGASREPRGQNVTRFFWNRFFCQVAREIWFLVEKKHIA